MVTKNEQTAELPLAANGPPISLTKFAKQIGRNKITLWRWRNQGIIKTINICGRQYITPREIENFNERAAKGDFAVDHKTPRRRGQSHDGKGQPGKIHGKGWPPAAWVK